MREDEEITEVLGLVMAEAARASPVPHADILALRVQVALRSRGIVVAHGVAARLLAAMRERKKRGSSV